MSGIGAVGGPDRQYLPAQTSQIAKKEEAVQAEPKDKVQISKAREVFEKVVGSPMGVIMAGTDAVGGFLGGGVAGLGAGNSGSAAATGIGSALTAAGIGAAIGSAIATPVVGGIVGGIAGLAVSFLSAVGGRGETFEKTADAISTKAKAAVSDNVPTESKVKDAARNFTEGALTGVGAGAVGGFKVGTNAGAGIVSGVIEGVKGAATAAVGKYEKPAEEKPVEGEKPGFGKKVLNAILSAPRVIVGTAVGIAGGIAGMGMEAIDGALQGTVLGVTKQDSASAEFTRGLMRVETAIGGTVTGFAFGGPLGAAIGLGSGLVLGHIINKVEKKSGTDKEIAQGITDAVKYAKNDNTYEDTSVKEHSTSEKTTYEAVRDGIEGLATGTAAGMREGFKAGFSGGKGAVDGFVEGAKGIVSGIIGGVTGR
ncbi:MAG: hypothetical protein LWY06_11265 [Firmicutes bacterium]|nr:hypothetical protein [Bacillota bacterium]